MEKLRVPARYFLKRWHVQSIPALFRILNFHWLVINAYHFLIGKNLLYKFTLDKSRFASRLRDNNVLASKSGLIRNRFPKSWVRAKVVSRRGWRARSFWRGGNWGDRSKRRIHAKLFQKVFHVTTGWGEKQERLNEWTTMSSWVVMLYKSVHSIY